MRVSIGAAIVGALGLAYGLGSVWLERRPGGQRLIAIGGVGLLVAAIVLIVIPWAQGVPW